MVDDTSTSRDNWDARWARYAESAAENPAVQMRHRMIARFLRPLVIARGQRLARDVESTASAASSGPASFAMKLFRVLFHANLLDSPFGWQVIATARKPSP